MGPAMVIPVPITLKFPESAQLAAMVVHSRALLLRSGDPAAIRACYGVAGRTGLPTDLDGACVFDAVRPGRLDDGRGGRQASHINVRLFMRGLLRAIHARAYFSGDPALGEDAVLALVPESRRATLLAAPLASLPSTWTFDVRLQGEKETVFFDL